MGLLERVNKDLKVSEDSLIVSMNSFAKSTNLNYHQITSLYMLLDNFYRHALDAKSNTHDYSPLDMLNRLRDECNRLASESK